MAEAGVDQVQRGAYEAMMRVLSKPGGIGGWYCPLPGPCTTLLRMLSPLRKDKKLSPHDLECLSTLIGEDTFQALCNVDSSLYTILMSSREMAAKTDLHTGFR